MSDEQTSCPNCGAPEREPGKPYGSFECGTSYSPRGASPRFAVACTYAASLRRERDDLHLSYGNAVIDLAEALRERDEARVGLERLTVYESEAELVGLLAASREQVASLQRERDEARRIAANLGTTLHETERERNAYKNSNRDLHDENQRLRRERDEARSEVKRLEDVLVGPYTTIDAFTYATNDEARRIRAKRDAVDECRKEQTDG